MKYVDEKIKRDVMLAVKRPLRSYILSGSRGLGKSYVGKKFAKALLCNQGEFSCNCSSCQRFESGVNPDFFQISLIDNQKSIKLETIKELIHNAYSLPLCSSRKIILIDDADSITMEGQQALLKTVEEGLDSTIFIFITHREEGLLPTIKSRSITIGFVPASKNILLEILQNEAPNLSDNRKEIILAVAQGAGRALQLSKEEEFFLEAEKLIELMSQTNQLSFLNGLGLFKEKDSNHVYDRLYRNELIQITNELIFDLIKCKVGDFAHLTFKNRKSEIMEIAKNKSLKLLENSRYLFSEINVDITRDELSLAFYKYAILNY